MYLAKWLINPADITHALSFAIRMRNVSQLTYVLNPLGSAGPPPQLRPSPDLLRSNASDIARGVVAIRWRQRCTGVLQAQVDIAVDSDPVPPLPETMLHSK